MMGMYFFVEEHSFACQLHMYTNVHGPLFKPEIFFCVYIFATQVLACKCECAIELL